MFQLSPWILGGAVAMVLAVTTTSTVLAYTEPPLQCTIENGFDYVGFDIKNVSASQPEECCHACGGTTECVAYSWTSGTCYLKSGRDEIVANPNVKSAVRSYQGYRTCVANTDVDFVGSDIGNVPAATAGACCDACKHASGCRAYTWTNYNGGTCWLKSKVGARIASTGAISAEVYPKYKWERELPRCELKANTDIVGHDMGSKPSPNAELCCTICAKTNGCIAYAWNNYNGGTCWLKDRVDSTRPATGVTSSQIASSAEYQCQSYPYFDFRGNDLSNVRGTKESCCGACLQTPGCKAYTWSNFNGGTCWLKTKAPTNYIFTMDKWSGIVGF